MNNQSNSFATALIFAIAKTEIAKDKLDKKSLAIGIVGVML